ncbi:MAG: hypothetical protein JXA33_03095 [Anaerolineae bacterium]|nr:hypothetical protein [Anaerolineae bacterium]
MAARVQASDKLLRFQVLTPERTLLALDTVAKVRVRLSDGIWLSVYPRHAPLIAETQGGTVYYTAAPVTGTYRPPFRNNAQDVHEGSLELAPGILYITNDVVTLFTYGLRDNTGPQIMETEDMQFDRLARALLLALNAYPDGVLATEE